MSEIIRFIMDREQAKNLWPIIKAFAAGKQLQHLYQEWEDVNELTGDLFVNPELYRIKPEPKYRPFKDAEEFFEEMKKHQPFAWIKDKQQHEYFNMISICINAATTFQYDEMEYYDYQKLINEYTFADGTPFGVKVME